MGWGQFIQHVGIGSANSNVNILIEPFPGGRFPMSLFGGAPQRSRLHRIRLSEPPNRNRIGQWEPSKTRDPHSLPM